MNWKEHHDQNARRLMMAGIAFLVGSVAFGLLDSLFHWTESPGESMLVIGQIAVLGFISIGAGFSQKRKANRKRPNAVKSGRPSADGIGHSGTVAPGHPDVAAAKQMQQVSALPADREMMLKPLAGWQATFRYFSVDGAVLLEFRETSSRFYMLADMLSPSLRGFLPRTFVLRDGDGQVRLTYRQKAGLNPPVTVQCPDGTTIALYRQHMRTACIDALDESGNLLGQARKDDLLGTSFTVAGADGRRLAVWLNGGLPSRNGDDFSMSDDLLKLSPEMTAEPLLYMRIIGLPAFIKVFYAK